LPAIRLQLISLRGLQNDRRNHISPCPAHCPPGTDAADRAIRFSNQLPNWRAHYPNLKLNSKLNPKQDNLCEELARTPQRKGG
jgi:hypothetical protein